MKELEAWMNTIDASIPTRKATDEVSNGHH